MKFEILNRLSGEVQFTAEIDCAEDAAVSLKLGLAVKWAVKTRANLAGADLAGANLAGADLARANLSGAYLADADLARANLAGANLAGADLSGANLSGAYLADADLARANLSGAYLADADLSGANLSGANLAGANLARANLSGAYLADALKIDSTDIPVVANIDAAILKAIEAGGALEMGAWHTCETTHCRAGWAIHLAGEKGKALEERVGSQMAGTLIYQASRPGVPAPHFYATNERALEDLKRCAAEYTK